ncbi:MAG: DMT family transporter [Halioglobus sp.]|nr:DMT family transporter [Halioglobus sp.]
MSNTSGSRRKIGALLAVVSVAFWALLPVVSKGLLDTVDAYTLNFYRFVMASLILSVYSLAKSGAPLATARTRWHYAIFGVAVAGLLLNHILFMDALQYIPAGASQIIAQLGPIGLLLVSVLFLGEPFTRRQWLGTLVFTAGLLLFFEQKLGEILAASSAYAGGVLYMSLASLIWIFYGLGQKLLVAVFSPVHILLSVYAVGALVLLPVSEVAIILELDGVKLGLLVASCLTSLIAYICFGESVSRWDASKSSALLAVIPLITLLYENLLGLLLPAHIEPDALTITTTAGAVVVVIGCLTVTRGRQSP